MVKDSEDETLDSLQKYLQEMDLIITEGYKNENKPQIEVLRKTAHKNPFSKGNHNLIALVTDSEIDLQVPRFGLDDFEALANMIETKYLADR